MSKLPARAAVAAFLVTLVAVPAAAVVAGLVLLWGAVARAEPHRMVLRALAPLPFLAVVFLLHLETRPERMALLLLRALSSALALVLLLSTTPFVDCLRVLGVVLPRSLAAALAVLYRSLFILLRASSHAAEAARLRGARAGPGAIVGGLLLHAFERMENVACVMHARGVDAPDPDRADALRPRALDAIPLGFAAAALAVSILSRVHA